MEKDELNLDELLEDIRRIKNTIKQKSYVFRHMLYLPVFKLIFLIAGFVAFIAPLLYYFILEHYGNYSSIPSNIRLSIIIFISLVAIMITFGKGMAFFQTKHSIPQASFLKIMDRLFSRQVLLLYPVIIGCAIFLVIFFLQQHCFHLLVPTIAIGFGICFSIIGSFISFSEFFLFGTYFCVLGTLSVPFIIAYPRASLLWTSGIFGLGMLVFSIWLIFVDRPHKQR